MPRPKKNFGASGKRVRGKARTRDPDKPRRPKSAYNLYAAERYQDVRKAQLAEDPNSKATAVIAQIAVEWKGLSKSAKAPFLKKAAAAKKLHDKAMDEYRSKEKERKKQMRLAAKTDKTKPKRAMSAYLFFGKAQRDNVKAQLGSNYKVTDVMKEIAKQWAELPQSRKAKYQKLADDARATYMEGMKKWKDDQKAVLHSSWKNKWKAARKAEVEAYYAETEHMTGAQLLDLKGDAAKDIKRPNSKRSGGSAGLRV